MINDLIGKEIAGKYRLDSLVRETELGDLYHGTNVATGVPVTVKILAPAMAIDQRYVDRFLNEAKAAAGVSHRNLLNSIDVGTDAKGLPFAVFEAASGEMLRELIRKEGRMEQPRAVALAKQIAAALAAIHAKNVTHGGLNPDKVFVKEDGPVDEVKICDLGVRPHARNSMSGVPYLAPEQCSEMPSSDARSDIYALGAMLYEMVAGEPPFAGSTPAEVIRKQNDEPPAPLSAYRKDLHPQLEPIILTAIAADPERRYMSTKDLEEDLGQLAAETGATLPSDTAAAAAVGAKRNIWQTAFIVLAGVAVLAGVLIYFTSTKRTDPTASLQPDANSSPVQPINPATGAQEEYALRLGDIGDPSMLNSSNTALPPGTLPGGDGYNAWANGGAPPAGAPLTSGPLAGSQLPGQPPAISVAPGGQNVTIDPNGGSVFMPNENGVILVPIPANAVPPKATPTPKTAANTSVRPTPKPSPVTKPTVPKADQAKPTVKNPGGDPQ
jgi:serine/threonine protein kinase